MGQISTHGCHITVTDAFPRAPPGPQAKRGKFIAFQTPLRTSGRSFVRNTIRAHVSENTLSLANNGFVNTNKRRDRPSPKSCAKPSVQTTINNERRLQEVHPLRGLVYLLASMVSKNCPGNFSSIYRLLLSLHPETIRVQRPQTSARGLSFNRSHPSSRK